MTSDELIELIINGPSGKELDEFGILAGKDYKISQTEKQKKGEDEPLLPTLLDLIEQELKKRSKQTSTEQGQ